MSIREPNTRVKNISRNECGLGRLTEIRINICYCELSIESDTLGYDHDNHVLIAILLIGNERIYYSPRNYCTILITISVSLVSSRYAAKCHGLLEQIITTHQGLF